MCGTRNSSYRKQHFRSTQTCHPDRSVAKRRDLLFYRTACAKRILEYATALWQQMLILTA